MVRRVINPKAGAGGLGRVIRGSVTPRAPAGKLNPNAMPTISQRDAELKQAAQAAKPKQAASSRQPPMTAQQAAQANKSNIAQAQKFTAAQQKAAEAQRLKAYEQKLTAKPKAPTRGK